MYTACYIQYTCIIHAYTCTCIVLYVHVEKEIGTEAT